MSPTADTLSARRLAFAVLERVATGGYADRSLDAALRRQSALDPRDRGLATELVYGVLRQQGRLDYALTPFCRQPLTRLEPRALLLLRLGAYQVLCLDRVPDSAAVDTSVQLARTLRLERLTGLVNGVLRALVRGRASLVWPDARQEPLAHLQNALSLPHWLAVRWLADYGADEAIALAGALQHSAPTTLRANTLKLTREQLLQRLAAAGHGAVAARFAPEGIVLSERGAAPLPGDDEGWYQVQDEASMLIAHLLAPRPGERLLDCCAAPGGKTTHLAALTGNRAEIVALDLHPHRVKLIEQGAARLGCTSITAQVWDMSRTPDFLEAGSFAGVLVDAPCSGLGVLRRNPEARWRLSAADIAELQGKQQQILASAAPLVRPGGRLVYSVCTFTREETEEVVGEFLAGHPQFARLNLTEQLPADWHELIDATGALRSWPHRQGLDGFYAVVMQCKELLL
ncbi:MAG: 16S rRNA (cytosine(967)-C(5))-methyltransferase RsmB [Desulfuromonadales bacterium]|nr:16S rRNA (cytosine(967)-C(5))-methyltransferase RsmB [Desulfuromonadales bacterium]